MEVPPPTQVSIDQLQGAEVCGDFINQSTDLFLAFQHCLVFTESGADVHSSLGVLIQDGGSQGMLRFVLLQCCCVAVMKPWQLGLPGPDRGCISLFLPHGLLVLPTKTQFELSAGRIHFEQVNLSTWLMFHNSFPSIVSRGAITHV